MPYLTTHPIRVLDAGTGGGLPVQSRHQVSHHSILTHLPHHHIHQVLHNACNSALLMPQHTCGASQTSQPLPHSWALSLHMQEARAALERGLEAAPGDPRLGAALAVVLSDMGTAAKTRGGAAGEPCSVWGGGSAGASTGCPASDTASPASPTDAAGLSSPGVASPACTWLCRRAGTAHLCVTSLPTLPAHLCCQQSGRTAQP